MPAFSDVPDRDAHIPEEPGPDVERYWPASTRAIAIEYARRARLRSRGERAVDDATLERVADAIMDPANPPPWRPLTVEERRDTLPERLWEAVHGYLIDHPEVDGCVDVSVRSGRTRVIVGITGDSQAHEAALAAMGGDRVVIEPWPGPPPHTDAELLAIAERVRTDAPELAAAGWHVEDILRSCDGREIHVHPYHAGVRLREPVGNRVVIDASAGVGRPSIGHLHRRRARTRSTSRHVAWACAALDPPHRSRARRRRAGAPLLLAQSASDRRVERE